MFSQVIFKITITGTARIIPIKPHIHPHIDRDTIMINGDTAADYGAVMSIMGKLKDAGFQRVGLRTQLDSGQ